MTWDTTSCSGKSFWSPWGTCTVVLSEHLTVRHSKNVLSDALRYHKASDSGTWLRSSARFFDVSSHVLRYFLEVIAPCLCHRYVWRTLRYHKASKYYNVAWTCKVLWGFQRSVLRFLSVPQGFVQITNWSSQQATGTEKRVRNNAIPFTVFTVCLFFRYF